MTAYTSTQAGNWSSSATWGGAGVPTDGDTVSIGHDVHVTIDETIGTSADDDVTNAVLVNSTGKLFIDDGVTLTCKGNCGMVPTTATATGLQIDGSGKLLFDGSDVGPGRIYKLYCGANARVILNGTDDANRATVDSAPGAATWTLFGVNPSIVTSNFGLVSQCGSASSNKAGSGQTITITNTKFDRCGVMIFEAVHATGTIVFENNHFTNSIGSPARFTGFAGASCNIDSCVFDGQPLFYLAENWVVTNSVFSSAVINIAPSKGWKTGSGNNLYVGGNLGWRGSMEDVYYFHNAGDNLNYIPIKFNCTGLGETLSGIVMDYGDTSRGQPDGLGITDLDAGTSYLVRNNIQLTDPSGSASGAFLNHYAADTMNGNTTIEHNTYPTVDATQSGVYVGEGNRGITGMISSFKSNIAWTPAVDSPGYKFIRNIGSTTQDFVAAADADYNWGWNLAAGSEGNGYNCTDTATTLFSSGTPDVNGGNADPGFTDPTRNLIRYDIDKLGNSVATAWTDATSYVVGDVVSASDAGYLAGSTINWRCIAAHTSNSADATNGKPGAAVATGFRTNWEPQSLFRLREDTSRIADLMTWVRAGFAPTNEAYRDAGHDGVTVGAVEMADIAPSINAMLGTDTVDAIYLGSDLITQIL